MTWSAVKFAPYNSSTESIYALNGTARKRIEDAAVYEWGLAAPLPPPELTLVAGTLSGDYNVKYTYARCEGNTVVCDSNPSPEAGTAASPSTQGIRVTFAEPTDPQVNRIRFWRTADGGTSYFHESDLPYPVGDYGVTQIWEETDGYEAGTAWKFTTEDEVNGTENTYAWEAFYADYDAQDSTIRLTGQGDITGWFDLDEADSALGAALHSDHDPPPAGDQVFGPTFDGTLFIIKGHYLYYSKPKQPEYWPPTYYVLIGPPHFPGKCGVLFDKQPFVLTQHRVIYIYGTSSTDFLPKETAAKTGTVSPRGAVAIEGYGIFHVALDGVYLAQPSTDNRYGSDAKLSLPFDRLFRGESVAGMNAVGDLTKSWLMPWRNKLLFGYPNPNATYATDIIVFYLDTKRVGYWTHGIEISAVCEDFANERLLAADINGYIWVLEDKTVTDDDGTAISWEVESKEFTLQTRAHFPRWNKYDVDASHSVSASGILLLDGGAHHTHTLTADRDTRRRLVDVGNGERCSIRLTGSGPVEIYAVEAE